MLRFQRALRLTGAGGRLADVAAVVGYADQAHMARDTRRLAGAPLSDLVSQDAVLEPSQAEHLES